MAGNAPKIAPDDAILVEPLAPAVGLSVRGVDLTALTDDLTAMLQDLWQLGGALLFRGCEDPRLAVASLCQALVPDTPLTETSTPPGGTGWAMVGADASTAPPVVCAAGSADTLPALWLAGMEAAADALHLTGVEALSEAVGKRFAHRVGGPLHPALVRHAVSGAGVLYPPPRALAEHDGPANALVRHAEQPQFHYRHIWQRGDVFAWDPRAVRSRWEALPTDTGAAFITLQGSSPLQAASAWPPEPFL